MTLKANAGDCFAAGALADHYLNVSLDFDAGLKWSRLGANCPGLKPKERLISLLAQVEPSSSTTEEINELLEEIRKLDSAEAKRISASITLEQRLMSDRGTRPALP